MELNLPKVSFVVTSFNYAQFIEKTLISIKDQSYENFEIIIVDDFSADNSIEIIENFISSNPELNVKLIKHDKNYGQFKAIQKGLRECSGEFVSFIDSDDILLKDYAKELVKLHLETSIALISCQLIEMNENDEILSNTSTSSTQSTDKTYKILNLKNAPFGGWFWSAMPSGMFRKASIEIILNYENYEDWKICPDKFMFNFANLIGGSALLFKPLVAKRRHNNNAGFSDKVVGNKRFNNDKITKLNIENNKKIRPLTINFIKSNKDIFFAHFGKNNTISFLIKIRLSYFYCIKQVLHYVKKLVTP